MSQLMDLLRGPALGVIGMIILMAGVLIITCFAALIAQMSLLFRLKPWNTSEKHVERTGSETGKGSNPQGAFEHCTTHENRPESTSHGERSSRVVVVEPDSNEVVDGIW